MKLLDTFCKAGGATKGYQMAGFEVVGVDIEPQPHYCGDAFIQADALNVLYALAHGDCWPDLNGRDWHLEDFAAIHASPPCQFGSEATPTEAKARHTNLIPAVQIAVRDTGLPYVIENVEGNRRWLRTPVILCGSMFGMAVWRHRYFEIEPFWMLSPASCLHKGHPFTIGAGSNARKAQGKHTLPQEALAMGIDWMTGNELAQAVPPAYTEFIGNQLVQYIKGYSP